MKEDKIRQLLQKLTSSPGIIDEVELVNDEFYFRVGETFWSCLRRENNPELGGYSIYYYPHHSKDLKEFAVSVAYGDQVPLVSFHAGNMTSQDDEQLFANFYAAIHEAYFKVNKAIDDVLSKKA